jgi:RNA polymerase sigma factor (sigma-70 family)
MSTTISTTPHELIRAAQKGDPGALDQLVNRYTKLVWSTVRSYGLRDADADDVVQTIWLRMIEHLPELRDARCMPGWLATISRRECLKAIRQSRRELVGLDPSFFDRADDRSTGPEQRAIDRTMTALLWEQVDALPPVGRELIVTLTASDAPRYAEYARRRGVPIGSIGPTRMRYLRKLRHRLEKAHLGSAAWR